MMSPVRTNEPKERGLMQHARILAAGALCVIAALGTVDGSDVEGLLGKLRDPAGEVRRAAWEGAGAAGAEAVRPLAELCAGENKEAALAASRALERIAHASAAPGAKGRKEVAAALADIAGDEKIVLGVRTQACDLLGLVAEAETVPSIARLLGDESLRDPARKALERIPGRASEEAVEKGIAGAAGEFRDALILTLGRKRAKGSVPALRALALAEGGGAAASARVAAAKALARIGDLAAADAIFAAMKTAGDRDRSALAADLVKMGDDLRAAGNEDSARKIYQEVLASAGGDAARYAALHALFGKKIGAEVSVLLSALDDASPRVGGLALDLLTALEGGEIDRALAARYETRGASGKPALLRALEARKAPGVEDRLAAALAGTDIDLKVTALDLSGKLEDPSSEAALVAALEKGSASVKDLALGAYLQMADSRAGADSAAAAKMYVRVLDSATDVTARGRALVGLGRSGEPEAFERIEKARKDPEVSRSADEGYIELARAREKRGEKARALEMLLSIVGSDAPRETVQMAARAIRDLGGDPTILQKRRGFLASWRVVGPFPNVDGKGFDAVYSPEEEVRLDAQKDARGRTRRWQEVQSTSAEGMVDLAALLRRTSNVCAYAYAEIELKEARDVRLKLGSDDGVVVWLNGKKVHANNTTRAFTVDEDVVDARLEAGKNRVLLKVTQGDGQWEFALRITDRADKPIDLSMLKG